MGNDDGVRSGNELSLDACLEVLANRQRRAVLGYFLEADTDNATIDELVAEIIDAETRATGERPGHDTIATTLFHVHLPKFENAGVIEYEPRHLDVRYRGDSKIEELYRMIEEYE